MKVTISAGGRFHAQHLARELAKRQSLAKLYTFDYSYKKNNLRKHHVDVATTCKIANIIFEKARLARFFDRRAFNYYKDRLFDAFVTQKLKEHGAGDIFVGWSNGCLNSLQEARKHGSLIVVESGSTHIQHQMNKLTSINRTLATKLAAQVMHEYDQSDYIVVPSSYAEQTFLDRGFSDKKIIKIPLGIDTHLFNTTQRLPHTHRMHFLFASQLTHQKGIITLLDAWKKAALPATCVLTIVGTAQRETAALINTYKSKNIHFTGGITAHALSSLYKQADVFLHPTQDDGFGMVIAEAMASGCCVVTTPFSAGPDLINEGKTGFIKNPLDTDAWSEFLWWAYHNRSEAHSIGQAAAEAAARWTWDNYGSKIYHTYWNML